MNNETASLIIVYGVIMGLILVFCSVFCLVKTTTKGWSGKYIVRFFWSGISVLLITLFFLLFRVYK